MDIRFFFDFLNKFLHAGSFSLFLLNVERRVVLKRTLSFDGSLIHDPSLLEPRQIQHCRRYYDTGASLPFVVRSTRVNVISQVRTRHVRAGRLCVQTIDDNDARVETKISLRYVV